ncbi:bifunctional MaoC family dehydratase N-terminal/OB-fold nucleic acid binding domain-containing protein [Denitratisoma oestradiolicum]|nr:OB-fold domain-containing protein [Denitratisoma oestradiolicum]
MVGTEYGLVYSWDKVNLPMIRQWCEAMGNESPIYQVSTDGTYVAPPTMMQVWVLAGLNGKLPPGSSQRSPFEAVDLLLENGFPAVVAVNCEQEYFRYARVGESLKFLGHLETVSELKTTALGTGHFVTNRMEFFNEIDEPIGEMRFRFFVYKPHQCTESAKGGGSQEQNAENVLPVKECPPRPGVSQDTKFFWDGLKEGKLLIQQCSQCKKLRHPPGPVCPTCHSFDWNTIQSSGEGVVHSFVVMHHPQVPGYQYPHPVLLVELKEGVRVVAGLTKISHEAVKIGMLVMLDFLNVADGLVLPAFRPMSYSSDGT